MSLIGKKWVIQNQDADLDVITKLHKNRDLDTEEKKKSFFDDGLSNLHDPYLMKGMGKAVDKIQEADTCIDNIEQKMFKKADLFWAIILTLLVMMIVIVLFILQKLYKKFNILRLLKITLKTKPKTDSKPLDQTYFEEKLKKIKEGLEG